MYRVKKGVIKELFSEIVVFLVRKGSYTTFNIVKMRKIWEKKGKIRKTWSMTNKKGHQKFWPWKWKFFPKKTVIQKSEILDREKIFRLPQTRRQVSASDCHAHINARLYFRKQNLKL